MNNVTVYCVLTTFLLLFMFYIIINVQRETGGKKLTPYSSTYLVKGAVHWIIDFETALINKLFSQPALPHRSTVRHLRS